MSATTAVLPSSEPAVPVRSGWRRAVLVFAALGTASYVFGRLVGRYGAGTVSPQVMMMATMLGPALALVGFGLWWCFLGDGGRGKRVLSVLGVLAAIGVIVAVGEEWMRVFVGVWGVPLAIGITGLVLAAVPAARWWPAAALIGLSAVSPWLALRLDGVTGQFELDTSPRWKPSVANEAERLLADEATIPGPTGPAPGEAAGPPIAPGKGTASGTPDPQRPGEAPTGTAGAPGERSGATGAALGAGGAPGALLIPTGTAPEWPGFRGALRTAEVPVASYRGWDGSQPRERWRKKPVGPAWSSICAVGEFLYTQEQRGENESVVCYRADTGKVVWARGEPGKHSDPPSGAGPRATPSLADGRVFAVTAAGTVCAVRAWNGEPLWQVNLAERFGATKPVFGLSTSPLVLGDTVIINPGSPSAPRLVALDAATGKTRWQTDAKGTDGYSSPHIAIVADTPQLMTFNGAGLFGHDPATGRELWSYDWVVPQNEPTTVQPLVLPDGRVIIGGGNVGTGTRCVKVQRKGDAWSVSEEWKITKFTPKFNDVVRVGDNLFGLDSGRLVCLDLSNGAERWKEGEYGAGQLLLVGDKLLIATERGQLACVAAKAEEYEELWKMDVVKGKTWNHPVIARGRLYYRNTTEMVAFDLPGWKEKE